MFLMGLNFRQSIKPGDQPVLRKPTEVSFVGNEWFRLDLNIMPTINIAMRVSDPWQRESNDIFALITFL